MHHAVASVLVLTLSLVSCTGTDRAERVLEEVEADLPEEWDGHRLEDDRTGTFVVSAPAGSQVWSPGDETAALEAAAGDTAWGEFWLPKLRDNPPARSNVRAVVLDTETLPGEVVSWQINVAPLEDLPQEASALAVEWSNRFLAQGLEVRRTTITEWTERNIAAVSFDVPAEVFAGESRHVRQWFVPDPDADRLWSLVCDGPADPVASQTLCRTALDGFRLDG